MSSDRKLLIKTCKEHGYLTALSDISDFIFKNPGKWLNCGDICSFQNNVDNRFTEESEESQ